MTTSLRAHGLDSLRILAEYAVVQAHLIQMLSKNGEQHQSLTQDMFILDLMSFFFVLSGTVSMMNPPQGTAYEYWYKKLLKVGPVYYFCLIWGTIGELLQGKYAHCPVGYVCILGDYLLFSQWLNCSNTDFVWVGLGWYLQILMTFWMLFPFFHEYLLHFYEKHTWPKLITVYGLSLIITNYIPFSVARYAPIHLISFIIGCGVPSTFNKRLPRVSFFIAFGTMLGIYFYNHLHLTHEPEACLWNPPHQCNLFPYYSEAPTTEEFTECDTVLYHFITKMDLVWVIFIHSVVTNNWLQHTIFKIVNPFSLFVYMFHNKIGHALFVFARVCYLDGFWNIVLLLPTVYYICWIISRVYSKMECYLLEKIQKKPQVEEQQVEQVAVIHV